MKIMQQRTAVGGTLEQLRGKKIHHGATVLGYVNGRPLLHDGVKNV